MGEESGKWEMWRKCRVARVIVWEGMPRGGLFNHN